MNLVGSGCWKTFNFKSMKNSKSSSVKPTTVNDETIPVIKKESKKGSFKDQQSKSPLLKTFKSNHKHGSFRESDKGGGKGGVGKVLIHGGNNQISGSKNIPPSTKSTAFTMVTNLRRTASFPLMIDPPRTTATNGKQSGVNSVPKVTINKSKPIDQVNSVNSESMFQFFDKNGNGFISEDELIEMMDKLGEPITRHEAKLMIKEGDSNHDGKIDYSEFNNLLKDLPLIFSSPSSMSLREAFKIFDKDSDGYVNMEEVKLISTAIGIDMNEKSIDLIAKQLQSTATPSLKLKSTPSPSSSPSSSPSPTLSSSSSSSSRRNSSEKINFDQLEKFFNSITKK